MAEQGVVTLSKLPQRQDQNSSDLKAEQGVVTFSNLPKQSEQNSSDLKAEKGVVTFSNLPKQSDSVVNVPTSTTDVVVFHSKLHTYKVVSYPQSLDDNEHMESILWMRTVFRHLKMNTSLNERQRLFKSTFGSSRTQMNIFNRRFPAERSLDSKLRVKYSVISKRVITTQDANKRAKKRCTRTAYKVKSDQENVFRATAALIRFGLLKSGGKYDLFRRLHKRIARGQSNGTYGVSIAQYPTADTVKGLADAIYNHSDLLTNSPDWVIKYRKGRLKLVDDQLFLPTQQITVSKIPLQQTTTDTQSIIATQCTITNNIQLMLKHSGLMPVVIKVRKGMASAAAYVYFDSAYEARCAVQPLRQIGIVSLGQTIVTSRVVASKVMNVVYTLLSEADGILSKSWSSQILQTLVTRAKSRLHLQEWIDKDGRVTFIKLKLVDPSYTMFQGGESRVCNLLEYVGDECECRRFYPILVDQFAKCNDTTFYLPNGVPTLVILTLTSGDHKAAWHKTGRSGGHEQRDLFSDKSRASFYHLLAYQDQPNFKYSRHVDTYHKVEAALNEWTIQQRVANQITTQAQRRAARMNLYYSIGRVECVPALKNGEHSAQPKVYGEVYITPLVLHNQTHCNLVTLELGLKYIVTDDSPNLWKLQQRLRGLQDGIGTTKCATSGTGIRHLINDCLILESDTHPNFLKYASIWYLMDLICYHLKLKAVTTSKTPVALMSYERFAFTASTFLWWALIGDLSTHTGGRTLKKRTKNHLQDKIYAFELVNACPEWEEITKIPLSLIDEAIFEASFAPRDEMINSQRSKVAIEGERKISMFRDCINVLAPVKKYRSIMSRLPRHIRRNIIIRHCWQTQPKWSINITNGFFRRCIRRSYRDRIHLSVDQDIFLDITGPPDPFYDMETEQPVVIIDPCGACCDTSIPGIPSDEKNMTSAYTIRFVHWWSARIIRRTFIRSRLQKQHTHRLRECHLKRAHQRQSDIRSHLRRRISNRNATDFKACFDAYSIFQGMYPQDLLPIILNAPVKKLLKEAQDNAAAQMLDIWNGDTSTLPNDLDDIYTDKKWTVKKLKSIIRFFKVHGITDRERIKLGGKRKCLIARVISLVGQFRRMEHLSNQ